MTANELMLTMLGIIAYGMAVILALPVEEEDND